ncbi:pterin-4-alpha-carbinolamine dehydratase [Ectothiorhodospiraceae bacterium BW-2]|nr:pterin-4-alpha-carbinolamine dehydratase [Ectothiorhodospiraceae bacterium BW-2]
MKPWQERKRPNRLERRYEFADYEQLRDFLDLAAELSEQEAYYPDLGFGRNYVNVTIHAEHPEATPTAAQWAFAHKMDQLLTNEDSDH